MANYGRQRLIEMMNRVAGMPINEIDWEGEFSDVSKECLSDEALKDYFNKVIANQKLPSDKRIKSQLLVHNKAIPFDEKGELDIQAFIQNITKIPDQIYSQNAKMEKSDVDNSITFNVGIPALRGIVYDIEHKKFYVVNTCPGAGTCAKVCYARRGRYVLLPNIFGKQTRILNLLLNDPELFEKLLKHEIETLIWKNKGKNVFFRWNDAGDFFSKKYFEIAGNITKQLQAKGYKFKSYAHTKMGDIYNLNDPSMTLNFSVDAAEKERRKVDLSQAKTSEIVPPELFKDLFLKHKAHLKVDDMGKLIPASADSLDILKQRIADKFNVDINTLIMYDDIVKMPVGDEKKWNVIVLPKGQGDVAAQRKDVQRTFLLYH
jgi:hypothetical protein